ncbi:transcriptional regulator [Bacillus sp. EAC]|uniref:helix-turn-helix transcriptional regulator n=1 Tax=Bacillus sp. EAC TaxID=1978338 RepID=UPI000B44BD97|nr:PAS domain-containing protein [Bacillus sp. EAC]
MNYTIESDQCSNHLLNAYIPMVKFIASIMGKNCEVVLHDLTNPENSIVAIENGGISGRKVGGPITDLVLKVMQEGAYKDVDFISNYKASVKGDRTCRSSSYFIKNEDGNIIGVLCVNVDVTVFEDVKSYLDDFIMTGFQNDTQKPLQSHNTDVFESLHETVEDVLENMISKVLNEYDLSPERLSIDEKLNVVRTLNEAGLFLLKGGVSELANKLKVSEATVYRYLSKVK